MQHVSRLVLVVHHAANAAQGMQDAQPGAAVDRHWHTVLDERPCTALPDDDFDYFLRRPQVLAPHAAPPAPPALPGPMVRAMAAAFAS